MATLLLDGDENFRRALAVALRLEGRLAHEAADVERAATLLATLRFDTVVVDLLLPGARAFAARLAAAGDVQVVVCSPHRESFAGLSDGTTHLEKPFSAQQLIALLGRTARTG